MGHVCFCFVCFSVIGVLKIGTHFGLFRHYTRFRIVELGKLTHESSKDILFRIQTDLKRHNMGQSCKILLEHNVSLSNLDVL